MITEDERLQLREVRQCWGVSESGGILRWWEVVQEKEKETLHTIFGLSRQWKIFIPGDIVI